MGGKLTGERSRTVKYTSGKVISSGHPSESIEKGFAVAMTKPGIIGITVKILRKNVKLPDDIQVKKINLGEVASIGGNEGKVDTQNE